MSSERRKRRKRRTRSGEINIGRDVREAKGRRAERNERATHID
jgi:hypothetical protein